MTTEVQPSTTRPARVQLHVADDTVDLPHLGITMRVILAAAAQAATNGQREFKLRYRGADIGAIRLKR